MIRGLDIPRRIYRYTQNHAAIWVKQVHRSAYHPQAENLFVYSGVDGGKFLIAREIEGHVVNTPHKERGSKLIDDLNIDLLIIDPFIQTHFVSENSNEQISKVMVALREMVLGEYPAALNLIHHIRKPQPGSNSIAGDMYAARGAGSMQGEAHMVFTLADMTRKESEALGVREEDAGWYVRLDDAKSKLAAPSAAHWFEREGIEIPRKIGSEEIGALMPWTPDANPNEVPEATKLAILNVVDSRWKNERPFKEIGDNSLRQFMRDQHKLTRTQARVLFRKWVQEEVIAKEIYNKKSKTSGYRVINWPGRGK